MQEWARECKIPTQPESPPEPAIPGIHSTAVSENDQCFYKTKAVESIACPVVPGTKINLTVLPDASVGTEIMLGDASPILADGVSSKIKITIKVSKTNFSERCQ